MDGQQQNNNCNSIHSSVVGLAEGWFRCRHRQGKPKNINEDKNKVFFLDCVHGESVVEKLTNVRRRQILLFSAVKIGRKGEIVPFNCRLNVWKEIEKGKKRKFYELSKN